MKKRRTRRLFLVVLRVLRFFVVDFSQERTMLIKKSDDIKSGEITDEKHFGNRRAFIRGVALATTATATGLLYRKLATPNQPPPKAEVAQADPVSGYVTPSGENATSYEDITNYNNFYEFSTRKDGVAPSARNFATRP